MGSVCHFILRVASFASTSSMVNVCGIGLKKRRTDNEKCKKERGKKNNGDSL